MKKTTICTGIAVLLMSLLVTGCATQLKNSDFYKNGKFDADKGKQAYFDLMKKHDELLMELAEISFNPLESYYDWKMYFRGNENLLWRKLLDMTFPQKLSFFLFTGIEGIPAKQFQRKMSEFTLPDDQTSKKFMERLQVEFPECAELIESELSEHDSDPNEQIFCVPGDKDRAEEESGEETPPQ